MKTSSSWQLGIAPLKSFHNTKIMFPHSEMGLITFTQKGHIGTLDTCMKLVYLIYSVFNKTYVFQCIEYMLKFLIAFEIQVLFYF
jgi:hypothetical protein